jgi:hydrogenase-4 component F
MSVITPRSAALFVAGLFAVTACPPFGPFFSELLIVRTGLRAGMGWATALFLFLPVAGVSGADPGGVCDCVWPAPQAARGTRAAVQGNALPLTLPPFLLLLLALWLGLATPEVLREAWSPPSINSPQRHEPRIPFALLTNGTAHPWAEVPEWPVTELVAGRGG